MPNYFYASGIDAALNGEIDFDTNTIKVALTTSSYTPDRGVHDYFNDVTNEVVGTGYTAGGATLGTCTCAYVAANSWGVARANSTAYALGEVVRPATGNNFVYQCIVAGTSGGSIPTYPTTYGGTVTDGGVTWECVGAGGVVLDSVDPSWATSTITARYGVIYRDTGTPATSALIALLDFGSNQTSTGGTFLITFSAAGIVYVVIP
jgi:hypothetical protein